MKAGDTQSPFSRRSQGRSAATRGFIIWNFNVTLPLILIAMSITAPRLDLHVASFSRSFAEGRMNENGSIRFMYQI
jgi:hypothetical protein